MNNKAFGNIVSLELKQNFQTGTSFLVVATLDDGSTQEQDFNEALGTVQSRIVKELVEHDDILNIDFATRNAPLITNEVQMNSAESSQTQ